MDNMKIYEAGKTVPAEAKKTISAGRLKGFTDINPMWRIRKLTEMFGPCGIGWYYTVEREWLEPTDTGEVAAFVRIHLYIKPEGQDEWSKPIVGVGGSAFVANEKNGPRMSDEAYKMAQTDALSVACKNLGIGATVYWDKGETKYGSWGGDTAPTAKATAIKDDPPPLEYKCADCGKPFAAFTTASGRVLSAAQCRQMACDKNIDGIARCKDCREKAGTTKE